MSENSNGGVKEVRLKNLRALAAARKWQPADFVREVGKSPSYWSDMLRGAKGFGEKVAREIEESLQLPRLWLDQDHDRGEPVPVPQVGSVGTSLETVARAVSKLDKLDRRQVAALLPLLAEEPEARQAICKAIMKLLEPGTKLAPANRAAGSDAPPTVPMKRAAIVASVDQLPQTPEQPKEARRDRRSDR